MATASKRDDRISLRVTSDQHQLLEEAAQVTGKTLSAFVLDIACAEAHRALADRRIFLLDDEKWALFNEILDRPVTDNPALRELLRTPVQIS